VDGDRSSGSVRGDHHFGQRHEISQACELKAGSNRHRALLRLPSAGWRNGSLLSGHIGSIGIASHSKRNKPRIGLRSSESSILHGDTEKAEQHGENHVERKQLQLLSFLNVSPLFSVAPC
jgi:hypothetical protein